MERFRSRINPQSVADIAIWIFVALFCMLFISGTVPQAFVDPGHHPAALKNLQLTALVIPGLIFLGLRKFVSRAIKAELDAGGPGKVTVLHALTISIVGGISVFVFLTTVLSVAIGLVASRALAGRELNQAQIIAISIAIMLLSAFPAGLWAGWRSGFAGWAFAAAAYVIRLVPLMVDFAIQASAGVLEPLGAKEPLILSLGLLAAASGGLLGTRLYRRRAGPPVAALQKSVES